ncbi:MULTISPECIES: hypothetical protein [unclassified Bradyrhizobium]|uniref:hypothetical protein n=1 Tax=unclassified Bradyrhizobium TaxID=2631580 RepID=UPI001FF70202|nr:MULTISPECIES: hypothetical protein [unclassified Bradyrhizobium]MCK1304708.1 hypothetical protein [Bradyrhizobium sp. 45]MCK1608573.1 hypothetical protein [Bradyrhizobium sp. 163]MCK1766345.1 hypothetical protein [Bradyrhizobium sp. 136]
MLNETQAAELVRTLQDRSPLVRLTYMEALTVIDLMQQRGWKISVPVADVSSSQS